MRSAVCRVVAGALLLACAGAGYARAAAGNEKAETPGISLAPYFGVNIPTADLLDLGAGSSNPDSTFKLKAGVTFGGRLGIGLSPRVGLSFDVGYSPGSLEISQTGGVFNQDIKVLTGAGKVVYFLIPASKPLSANVSAGVAAVRHTVSAGNTSGLKSATNVGGVVGASAGFKLGQVFAMTASVEDYLYTATFDLTGGQSSKKQNDIRITGGIHFPFLGM